MLERFKKAVGYEGPIFDRLMRVVDTDRWENRKALVITRKKLVMDLIKLGIVNCKSLTLQWRKIDAKYYGSFLLGLSDGDGSVYVSDACWYWSQCGSHNIVHTTKDVLMEYVGLGDNKVGFNNAIYRIRYGGYDNLKRIYDFMYRDYDVPLERKKKKFLQCFEEHEIKNTLTK